MKVIFDHQLFSYQKYGGASKYFAELIRHLPPDICETTTLLSNNEYIKEYNLFNPYHFLPNKWFRGQGRIMNELNKPYSFIKLLKKNYDVFHQTHFETYCIKAIGDKPMVTTFHDTNFSNYNKNDKMVSLQKKSLQRANKVITISQNTKKDLIQIFNIADEKIEVIYHGVDSNKRELSESRIIEQPYLLFVGDRNGYKNFDRFIHAFSLLTTLYKDLHVICTRNKFEKHEEELFNKLRISDKLLHVSADEPTLARLYRDAVMFVFPSLYEGFGMPILEAMIQGCPVALADSSCFPEIAEDAALYFNPYEIDDIYDKIKLLLENESLRSEFIIKGKNRSALFSWEKSAYKHLQLYQSLL